MMVIWNYVIKKDIDKKDLKLVSYLYGIFAKFNTMNIYSLVKIDRKFCKSKKIPRKWFGHYVIINTILIGQSNDIFLTRTS
jgi:hypothetical protein